MNHRLVPLILPTAATGCGKTGLATGFLLQAIDRGHRGYFIPFASLVAELYASLADHSEEKVIKKYLSYDYRTMKLIGHVQTITSDMSSHELHRRTSFCQLPCRQIHQYVGC